MAETALSMQSAVRPAAGLTRPRLDFWAIWNMCFGFLGIQFAFALQNANVSRIFQTLGASLEQIPLLWIAAPLTGLLVQPLVGYASDRTWTRLGRRRPYFLSGAIIAALALVLMPHAPLLWVAAALLWMLDASINVSMEPFRAFVGDQLPPAQRSTGYAMQSFFIGAGAIVASMLPWLLAHAGVSNVAQDTLGSAAIPDTVRYSFYLGALVLFGAVGWTVLRSREYPPEVLTRFADADPVEAVRPASEGQGVSIQGLLWTLAGAAGIVLVATFALDKQLYVVCALALAWGLVVLLRRLFTPGGMLDAIMHELLNMPPTMARLVPVQFFSWLALFAMWIYTASVVAQVHFGSSDPLSSAYNEGANWAGVLFAAYNGFAALAAVVIPALVARLGLRLSHLVNLFLGGLGLASFAVIRDPDWLLVSMIGVGFAWASILSLPYALLADSVPAAKMGLLMGIFNFFIVIPQLVAASVLGVLLSRLLGGEPVRVLVLGGVCFAIAGLLVMRVPRPAHEIAGSTS